MLKLIHPDRHGQGAMLVVKSCYSRLTDIWFCVEVAVSQIFKPATFTCCRPDRLLSSMLTIKISFHPDLPSNQVRGGLPTAGNVEMHKPIAAASGLDNGLTFEAGSRPVSVMNIRPLLK